MDRNDELKLKYPALHIMLFLKKVPFFEKMPHKCCGKTTSIYILAQRHCLYVSPFYTHENFTLVYMWRNQVLDKVNLA